MKTKADLRKSLSQNDKRTLVSVSEICESVSMSKKIVRPLIRDLRTFKPEEKKGGKKWYSVDDVTDVIWGCRR